MPLDPTPPTPTLGSPGYRRPAPDSTERVRARSRDVSPLGVARTAFELLTAGPSPLALDTRGCPGLPDRMVPLGELRSRLLAASCPAETRDVVWRQLVTRSRTDGTAWTVACVGLALPALTRMAADLSERFAGDPSDVHAEILTAFLTALATLDLDRPGVMTRLRWAAYRGGHAAVRRALTAPTPCGDHYLPAGPMAPAGHPDLVLAQAVAEAVISRPEAGLIGATRLEHRRMRDWAGEHGLGYEAAKKVRQRAERRLVRWLRERSDTDDRSTGRTGSQRDLPGTRAGAGGRVSPIRRGSGFQGCPTTPHPNTRSEDSRCA